MHLPEKQLVHQSLLMVLNPLSRMLITIMLIQEHAMLEMQEQQYLKTQLLETEFINFYISN